MSIETIISQIYTRFASQDSASLAQFFRPSDLQHIANLRPLVIRNPSSQLEAIVKSRINDSAIADTILSFLEYVRSMDPTSADPQTLSPSLKILTSCYNSGTYCFRHNTYFTLALKSLSQGLVWLALRVARETGADSEAERVVQSLLTSLAIACLDKGPEVPSRRDAAFTVANGIFRIYFYLNNMKLCDNILKTTRELEPELDTRYSKAEAVMYRYFRGRVFLYQRRIKPAYDMLRKAFAGCTSQSPHNRRAILIHLIAVSLPLGHLPSIHLLRMYDLAPQYGTLIRALKLGDWVEVRQELAGWCDWHRRHGTYLLLREKLEVVCWRNLFRNLADLRQVDLNLMSKEQKRGWQRRLTLSECVPAAQRVFGDTSIDEDDVEGMAASLIAQGFLKGYVKTGSIIVFGGNIPRMSDVAITSSA